MPSSSNGLLRGLYVITDETLMPEARFITMAEQALQGGAAIIQYRDKSSDRDRRLQQTGDLKALCEAYEALLIINDDVELARTVNAHGVHLGADDTPFHEAREVLGDEAIIGVSCYADYERAASFDRMGADYLAFGAFFPSPTKPKAPAATTDLLKQARSELDAPVCAIGGITAENAEILVSAGADMVAVITGVFSQGNIASTARQISSMFL